MVHFETKSDSSVSSSNKSGARLIRRILLIVAFAAVLLGLVVDSQSRLQANYVSGLIEAEEIRLGSRVGGRVKSVLVNEGERITAGKPLIEFGSYDLLEREQQAVAVLAEREATLRKMTAGMRAQEIAQAKSRYDQAVSQLSLTEAGPRDEEISAAENRLKSAIANQQLADRENKRITELFQRSAVSKSEFDIASEKLAVVNALVAVRQD